MRILYLALDIRREIARIFRRQRQRRVALVAYVGRGATSHLPKNLKGLEIYCWPQPGGTSATAVRKLIRRGASVFFCDRLHMKVYWSEVDGAVVCSANLSDNALGSGNLREAGVALGSAQIDIDRLIGVVDPRSVSLGELRRLKQAEEAWNRVHGAQGRVSVPDFPEWFDGTAGKKWKWDYYDTFGGAISRRARRAAREIDPELVPQKFCYCKRGAFEEEDWILLCKLTGTGRLQAPTWVYVERVVLVEKTDRAYHDEYPFQAIQAREERHCPAPPFRITTEFSRALRDVSAEAGFKRMKEQVDARPPTRGFLKRLREHC
jgi:hypothetical protein